MDRSQEMQLVFKRWRESGLSLRAFGRQEDISYSKLIYWGRRFRRDEKSNLNVPKVEDSKASPWVPIHLIPNPSHRDSSADGYEVRFSNGLSVGIPPGFDEVELRRLVMVLAAC